MKFAQDFETALKREEYPKEWIDNAISYKQLKKCIRKVQKELQTVGLDSETLEHLWQHVPSANSDHATGDQSTFKYRFGEQMKGFTPKLTVVVDTRNGSPVDAFLTPETKVRLRSFALAEGLDVRKPSAASVLTTATSNGESGAIEVSEINGDLSSTSSNDFVTVDVPLTSDSEFFQILRRELDNLERLQTAEQKDLSAEISALGNELSKMTMHKNKKSKEEMAAWQEIFRLYAESGVFFSDHEQDAGARTPEKAQQHLEEFSKALKKAQPSLKLHSDGRLALDHFLDINASLLKFMKFQQINQTALTKIMKKFDKQTHLHAANSLPSQITSAPFASTELARTTCYTISTKLLQLIPTLDDYLCPICFSISFKPVRLKCKHVFCIRCLIVLQRNEQDSCPMCRSPGVLEVTEENLDEKLAKFLKQNFPDEVKQKQKDNERAIAVERFGEANADAKCCVM